jgi:hypothetical protein
MHQNKIFFIIAALVFIMTSCLKRYEPEIDSKDVNKFVVSGRVIKGDSIQHINISQTVAISEINHKYYLPVTGCFVRIIDNKENSYYVSDIGNGNYQSYIPDSMIKTGTAFKIEILIPNLGDDNKNIKIVSDYDTIQECPDVDSLYYMKEQLPSLDPYTTIKGIRFYCDLDAKKYSCRNFRFEVTETYEYKAPFAANEFQKVCYMSGMIKDIYTLSTKNLTENKYTNFPLHFVDNYSSQRLRFGYSLLIRQYSLSESTFDYWKKIQVNYAEQGGLYTKQPLQLKGNMHNLTYPEQPVLGFFETSEVKSIRIFVGKIDGLAIEYLDCDPPIPLGPKPGPECYNCLIDGGTNVKPSFWPY